MEISKLIKKALMATCAYFTVICAVYMLVLQVINIGDSPAVEAERVLLFFLFAFLFAIANALKGISSIPAVARYLIHYVITAFAFYACFLLPTGMRASFAFTGMVIFTLVYVLVMVAIGVFASRLKNNREKSEAYNTQFKKKK